MVSKVFQSVSSDTKETCKMVAMENKTNPEPGKNIHDVINAKILAEQRQALDARRTLLNQRETSVAIREYLTYTFLVNKTNATGNIPASPLIGQTPQSGPIRIDSAAKAIAADLASLDNLALPPTKTKDELFKEHSAEQAAEERELDRYETGIAVREWLLFELQIRINGDSGSAPAVPLQPKPKA